MKRKEIYRDLVDLSQSMYLNNIRIEDHDDKTVIIIMTVAWKSNGCYNRTLLNLYNQEQLLNGHILCAFICLDDRMDEYI